MDMSTPMSPKPLVNATCKLGEKGCFTDGRCHALGNCEHKIVTNADRIRAMSDGELASAILRYTYGSIDPANWFCQRKKECADLMDADKDIPDEICEACILEKLQQPSKEGD